MATAKSSRKIPSLSSQTHLRQAPPAAKAAKDAQTEIASSLATQFGMSPDQIMAAQERFAAVNLDEVVDNRIAVTYWHTYLEENTDPDTGESYRIRERKKRQIFLIRDIPSHLLLAFMELETMLHDIAHISSDDFARLQHLLWDAWKYTAPDAPFEDIQDLPLDKMVGLMQRFFM
jgi:hypothetical protein